MAALGVNNNFAFLNLYLYLETQSNKSTNFLIKQCLV